jgi:hypothetical protein
MSRARSASDRDVTGYRHGYRNLVDDRAIDDHHLRLRRIGRRHLTTGSGCGWGMRPL